MADPQLTYAGIPLISAIPETSELRKLIEQFQSTDWFEWSKNPYKEYSNGQNTYNWRPNPDVKINQVFIPTGATRFAYGFFLVDGYGYEQIKQQIDTERSPGIDSRDYAQLYGRHTGSRNASTAAIDMQMTMLQPRKFYNARTDHESLWILPLVDKRYEWQFRSVQADVTAVSSWGGLISAWFGISGGDIPVINGDYGSPDGEELQAFYGSNYAVLLDAVCAAVNIRVTYDYLSDAVLLMQHDTPPFSVTGSGDSAVLENGSNWFEDAGPTYGGYVAHYLPRKAAFYHRKKLDGSIQENQYQRTEFDFSSETTEYGRARISTDTDSEVSFWPSQYFEATTSPASNNLADLNLFRSRFAMDWASWHKVAYDLTITDVFTSIQKVTDAHNDYALVSLGVLCEGDLVDSIRFVSWPADVLQPNLLISSGSSESEFTGNFASADFSGSVNVGNLPGNLPPGGQNNGDLPLSASKSNNPDVISAVGSQLEIIQEGFYTAIITGELRAEVVSQPILDRIHRNFEKTEGYTAGSPADRFFFWGPGIFESVDSVNLQWKNFSDTNEIIPSGINHIPHLLVKSWDNTRVDFRIDDLGASAIGSGSGTILISVIGRPDTAVLADPNMPVDGGLQTDDIFQGVCPASTERVAVELQVGQSSIETHRFNLQDIFLDYRSKLAQVITLSGRATRNPGDIFNRFLQLRQSFAFSKTFYATGSQVIGMIGTVETLISQAAQLLGGVSSVQSIDISGHLTVFEMGTVDEVQT